MREPISAARRQEFYDMTYIATVIAQGTLVGAPPMVIAERIVKSDIPGMGFTRHPQGLNTHGLSQKDVSSLYGQNWTVES